MMKQTLIRFILFILLASFTLTSEACRFTVREIGFSSLSPTHYSFVIVDDGFTTDSPTIVKLQSLVKGSNMQVVLLSPSDDTHPYVQQAKAEGLTFPTAFVVTADRRLCSLFNDEPYASDRLETLARQRILSSPLRQHILSGLSDTFGYVLSIPGQDASENETVARRLHEDIARVKDIMSLMPKSVENPPTLLQLTADHYQDERVILWSLGIDRLPVHPVVYILYGRGRYMGNGLQLSDIQQGHVYRYLAMVGADCECNLDREWMLGTQIPLLWGRTIRQSLAESLDFDVDNPLIQAEMSRILSKEEPGGNSTLSFTPETIDLDAVFDETKKPQPAETLCESRPSKTTHILWITLGILSVVVISTCVYVIRRHKED